MTSASSPSPPLPAPRSVDTTLYGSQPVKRLGRDDFALDSLIPVALRDQSCTLVLFYVEGSTESEQLAAVWASVAQQAAGPVFAAVNMSQEGPVARAFTTLAGDPNSSYQWAGTRQFPFIMAYRDHKPVAVYNGERETQALIDWALTRACHVGYFETVQVGGSMQADNRLAMGPYRAYVNLPGQPPVVRTTSSDFVSTNVVRGFNPTPGLNAVGTATGTTAAAGSPSLTSSSSSATATLPGSANPSSASTSSASGNPALGSTTNSMVGR